MVWGGKWEWEGRKSGARGGPLQLAQHTGHLKGEREEGMEEGREEGSIEEGKKERMKERRGE